MSRLRDHNLVIGSLPPGRWNAITDVAGVLVGHSTLKSGDGPLVPGGGPVRTGVTVIRPHPDNLYLEKSPAAVYTINGFGKVAGFEQVRELGVIEAPIALTNTLNVGLVLDALVQYSIHQNPQIGVRPDMGSVNAVVGETNDSFLNDIQGRHVREQHVFDALNGASGGPVPEGAVGAGTGTICYGWKGGIGAASRVLPAEAGGWTVGALVQSNFGSPADLVIAGVPVGRRLKPSPIGRGQGEGTSGRGEGSYPSPSGEGQAEGSSPSPFRGGQGEGPGSIMIVLATDAPLDSRQLYRLCARAAAGLARTGSSFSHGSGDFVIAFSTSNRIPHLGSALVDTRAVVAGEAQAMNGLFRAVIESVEEAVLNSLFAAETIIGRDDHVVNRLPIDDVLPLLGI